MLTVFGKYIYEEGIYHILTLFHPVRKYLRNEYVSVFIDRHSRHPVCFSENQTARVNITAEHCFTVFHSPAYTALKKSFVKAVVCISRNNPYTDL